MECKNCNRNSHWRDTTIIEFTNDDGDIIKETYGVCELCETFHIIEKNMSNGKVVIKTN